MDFYTVAWLGWGLYFAVVEGMALWRGHHGGPDGTLSAHIWMWFGTDKHVHANTWAYIRRFILLAFMSWLTVHFVGGGRLV